MQRVVSGIITNKEGQVLVLRHNKCKGLLMFPVGKVETDENTYSALKREIFEETGIIVKQAILKTAELPIWCDRVDGIHAFSDYCYYVTAHTGDAFNKEPTKHLEIKWVDLKHIIENPKEYSYSTWYNALKI